MCDVMTSACWKATISHPCSLVKYLSLKLIRPSWSDHKLESEHHAEVTTLIAVSQRKDISSNPLALKRSMPVGLIR